MVFVWSQLCRGNPTYTVVQVAANDLVMMLAYAPIAALLLGVSRITVPWDTLQLSVALFVVIPLVAGWLTRRFDAVSGQALAERWAQIDLIQQPALQHPIY